MIGDVDLTVEWTIEFAEFGTGESAIVVFGHAAIGKRFFEWINGVLVWIVVAVFVHKRVSWGCRWCCFKIVIAEVKHRHRKLAVCSVSVPA